MEQFDSYDVSRDNDSEMSNIYAHVPKGTPPNLPMEVTDAGMVTLLRLVQLWKAWSPMEVTPAGITTEAKLWQPKKAVFLMAVTGLPSISAGIVSSPKVDSTQSVMIT